MNASAIGPLPEHAFTQMSGLEALQGMMAGTLPIVPISKVLNFTLVAARYGAVTFAGEPTADHLNPAGTAHGGWAAAILDSALGCAAHSTLAAGERYTSVEMKVNFLRPILVGRTGRLSCEGQIIHRGRTLALADARLVDEAGKVYAHASETCMIFAKAAGPGSGA